MKWVAELEQFEISYEERSVIKCKKSSNKVQALIDFIAELVDIPTPKAKLEQKKYENYL